MTHSPAWQGLIEDALDEAEAAALTRLASGGVGLLPTIGEETAEGIPVDIGWPRQKVAVDAGEMDATDRSDLEASGWTVVDASDDALVSLLRQAGIS